LFERTEEVKFQKKKKRRADKKEEKIAQDMAAAEVRKPNQIIYDQIASEPTLEIQRIGVKNFRWLTRELDDIIALLFTFCLGPLRHVVPDIYGHVEMI
jgi:hypothetical protein